MTKTVPIPAPAGGSTDVTRFNALRHGVLSRYTVLPWEDADTYGALLDALVAEHAPQGPTEEHLVEELAGILWRKRRLRQRRGSRPQARAGADARAVQPHGEGCARPRRRLRSDIPGRRGHPIRRRSRRPPRRHRRGQGAGGASAERAALRPKRDLRGSRRRAPGGDAGMVARGAAAGGDRARGAHPFDWDEEGVAYTADGAGLARFLTREVQPWLATLRKQEEKAPLIREQALGESLDLQKMERLARYEVHLDRKLERTLSMLLRLKDLRAGIEET